MDLILLKGGRVIHFVRIEACHRKDGSPSKFAVWRTTCKTCGAAFEVTTSASLTSVINGKALSTVNCPEHRKKIV